MEKFIAACVLVFGVISLAVVVSTIPALLWYCFDDQLALLTGNPALGQIPFLNMYAFSFFMMCLFKSPGKIVSTND